MSYMFYKRRGTSVSKTIVRVNKRSNPYVVIDKTALNDDRLSWKAKGVLCYLLSLPDDWKIYLNELKNHSSDGRDSTATAVNELIKFGYCTREVNRDEKGKITGYTYNIFEIPQELDNSEEKIELDKPCINIEDMDNQETENPNTDIPKQVKPNSAKQELLINNTTNDSIKLSNQSINHVISETKNKHQPKNDGLIEKYSMEYIREMLETDGYATDRQGNLYEELTNLVFDVVNSDSKTIKVNGTLLPTEVVRSRFLKLNPGNLLYVIEVFRKQTTKVHNIRQYLITALYNSFSSIDSYYTNTVNHDLYGAERA